MTATLVGPPAAAPAPPARHRAVSVATLAVVGVLALWLLARVLLAGRFTLALDTAGLTPLHRDLNDARDWVDAHRNTNAFFVYFLNYVQLGVEAVGDLVTGLIARSDTGLGIPRIGWLGLVAVGTWIAAAVGGLRVAVLTLAVLLAISLQGLWEPATDTLSLVVSATFFALLVGLPLGVWAGTSDRVHRIVTPVLDVMQILPSFAYLAPLVLVFAIGPASAIVATVVYAAPPVIRITAHGLRQVPPTTREAADSLGATGGQRLRTVLVPMARRTIVMGINQTVMAALSMVTIAALIGAPGLGLTVAQALQKLDVGTAFNAGLAIVLLAICFDRVTTAAGVRAETALRSGRNRRRIRRIALAAGFVAAAVAVQLSRTMLWAAQVPDGLPSIGPSISRGVDTVTSWVQEHFSVITLELKDWFSAAVLNPLESLLTGSPFFMVGLVLVVIAFVAGGWRTAVTALAAVAAMVGLGVWGDAMVTLAATLVATVLVMLVSIPTGVWMGRSRTADRILRPVLDAGQTMPAFVYLVPFLGLFGPSRFTAIVAAIVYAAPAAIKIVADGITRVPAATVEAATANGSTPWQLITTVQLPMSRSAIALAANQGLIYVLSMVVVGALVGAGALGYDVIAGLNQQERFGKGLAAGLTLVVLGILIDRTTQAAARRTRTTATTH
ncbi:ABC transporter permease [Nakamurella deserti]|uniref:ABC transporter permease n=1 Tax=Nakamurella deserti TaxID=2164074 RepID=UPI000DBE44E3|nr:ABC transporter permease subunit [Nakamurella deserti]